MLLKQTIGILILIMNLAGLSYLAYLGIISLKKKYFFKRNRHLEQKPRVKKTKKDVVDNDLIQDDDDLLKNMDLSDLDNLDLDDFD
ncbi:MAG: hypothetical protein GY729_08285 [Desulfobacteraceae bacterium]|nr:hypothetical protein [Desulfobacteraceae bacterium]